MKQAAYHSEGRYVAGISNYEKWAFNLKDHLGNVRVVFVGKAKATGKGYTVFLQQENHYYPFGLPMSGPWHESKNEKNDYLYNGKEYNTDLGLNWSDYGARFYDLEIGRFMTVDPMADMMPGYSPYSYSFNNPINYTDPDGQIPLAVIFAWAGKRAAAGAIADIVVQLAIEWVFNGGSLSDAWNRLNIDEWQVFRSAGENIVKGKFTAAALSAGGDLITYMYSNENWTWQGAFLQAGEGAISSLLGDKLGKAFLKKLRGLKVGKKLNAAIKIAIPKGFSNAKQFAKAGEELANALKQSGLNYNKIGVRGSSVTDISSKGGVFRVGGANPSDIDVFIEFSTNLGLNSSKNIPGFIHPGKLIKNYPALSKWSEKWSKILGREITPGGFQPGTFSDPNIIKF